MATERQKKAIVKVVENHGNVSKAMRESGYSKNSAKNPANLTKSKAWDKLMDKYIPDKLLAEKHKELLTTPIKVKTKRAGEIIMEVEQVDAFAISRGLDMGYKLKGRYKDENKAVKVEVSLSDLFNQSKDDK